MENSPANNEIVSKGGYTYPSGKPEATANLRTTIMDLQGGLV